MPKYWSYGIYKKVKVNEKARQTTPSFVGKTGVIIECLTDDDQDYKILFLDDTHGNFKEEELDLVK